MMMMVNTAAATTTTTKKKKKKERKKEREREREKKNLYLSVAAMILWEFKRIARVYHLDGCLSVGPPTGECRVIRLTDSKWNEGKDLLCLQISCNSPGCSSLASRQKLVRRKSLPPSRLFSSLVSHSVRLHNVVWSFV